MKERKLNYRLCKACARRFTTQGQAKYCSPRCRSLSKSNPEAYKYKSGWYLAKSGTRQHYDSALELQHMLWMDTMDVDWTKAHGIRIPYIHPVKKRTAIYVPDFLVRLPKGYVIQEMKPYSLINTPINQAKFSAAREWCKCNGYQFDVIFSPGQL